MTTKKPRKRKHYVVRHEESFGFIPKKFLDSLDCDEALSLAITTLEDLREVMIADAIANEPSKIDNLDLISGLNNTIAELAKQHPDVLDVARYINMKNNSNNYVYFC